MRSASSLLQSSLREAAVVAAVWILSCVYTVGYAALYAYRVEPQPRLILGMPAWVVWGILAPWTVCLVFTCWFALRGIRDEELGEEDALAASEEGLA